MLEQLKHDSAVFAILRQCGGHEWMGKDDAWNLQFLAITAHA